MATHLALPEGFVLDETAPDGGLPEGFVLDSPPQAAPEASSPAWADNIKQAGKGLAQTAVNVANIPGQVVNTALDTVGVPKEYQVMQLQLPESLRPTDTYAQLGAEIGPYLIPGLGQARTANALASVANAGRAERLATHATTMLAENLPGAIAQSTQNDDLESNLATGLAGSVVGRGISAGLSGAGRVINAVRGTAPASTEAAGAGANIGNTTEESVRRLANQREPDLASSLEGLDVRPRADVLDSAERLKVADNLLPSHYSGNQQYQAVEQALKSRAGSALRVQEESAISSLAKRAGQMIDEAAKTPDALAASERFVNQMDLRMRGLQHKSDQLYARVDKAMSPGARVEAKNTAAHLENQADELGGWENLDGVEKAVFKAVNPSQDGILTYANLNKVRRMVGQALYKNTGPYRDADQASLSRLYAMLSEDQRAVLGNTGAQRDFEVAQRLVQMRKHMEEQMVSIRGKTLTGDVTTRATNALQGMARGDGKGFRELMQNIPSRQMREEIIATSLRDMLSAGKRGADFNPGGFADWYQNMRTNGQLRLLAQHAPRELMSGLSDVYTVARAIQKAKANEITTGKLNEFVARFNRVTQGHEMAAKYAQRAGVIIGAKGGSFGALLGGTLGEKIATRARAVGGAESAEAAERLILSPEYQQAFRTATSNRKTAAADTDTRLRRLSDWKPFFNSLPLPEQRVINRVGLTGWLSAQRDDREY